jgi:phosphate:Na+ symporter
MVLATDGLRVAAGDSLRRALLRFTGGPLRALLTGAGITALVQSSSATTVATIGFVGAGLISFQQALGVIFGANIGTTATAWIVAGIGLKFSVTEFALPLVGVGALVRLFFRGRMGAAGMALAGFGVIFVGIDTLQLGMEGLSDVVTPSQFPDDDLLGRLALVAIGIAMTAILQSSSAAVATTITALFVGSISLEQAAALVIGQNIGTTVTAGFAAIGGSTAAKRTAFAHLLFNLLVGVLAFALLPLFVRVVQSAGDRIGPGDATITLAIFHSAFNVLGVAILLPFTRRFARLVTRVVKHRGPPLTRHLEPRIVNMGALAVEAVRQTTIETFREALAGIEMHVDGDLPVAKADLLLEAAQEAVDATEEFIAKLRSLESVSKASQRRHLSTLHALDHLRRLVETARSHGEVALRHDDEDAAAARERVLADVRALIDWCDNPSYAAPRQRMAASSKTMAEIRRAHRERVLEATAQGTLQADHAGQALESMRRLDEVDYYLWRICEHLEGERIQMTTAHET